MKRKSLRGLYAPELLESRIAPATIVVTTLVDDGSDGAAEMSLREAIELANNQTTNPGVDTIVFDPALIPVNPPSPVVTTQHATIVLTTQIDITDTLIIKGPGVDKLAISGDDNERIFNIDDGDTDVLHPTTISGLSFERGSATGNGGAILSTESLILKNTAFSNNYAGLAGGAIHVDTKGLVSISNSVFLNNTADSQDSGAMYAKALGNISVVKSLVSGNQSTGGDVGGMSLYIPIGGAKPAHILVDGVTFIGNSAGAGVGGGLWANNESVKGKVTVKNSTFTGNSATTHGGGFYLRKGIATVTGSTFSNNTAGTVNGGGSIVDTGNGGGLFAIGDGTASLTIKNTKFEGNSATGLGGGVHLESQLLANIAGSVFTGNTTRAEGGAISAGDTAGFTVASSFIAGNSATGFGGGGIFVEGTTLVLKSSTLSGNSATNVGGGLRGTLGSVITVTGGSFSGNIGLDGGGGIFTQGLGLDAVDLTVNGTRFTGNSANNGGAIFSTGAGEVLIKGAKILGNIANSNGGGMYLASSTSVTVSGSLFAGNRGELGGGLFLEGAGTMLVTGSSFLTNSAADSGGGINLSNTGTAASILKSKITGNVAGGVGGGIYGPGGAQTPVLTGSVVTGNFASDGANIYIA